MTARRIRSTVVTVAFLFILAGVLFGQDSRARIVRLSYIDGNARIDQSSSQGEQRAILNMPVVQGTRLMAEDGSRVEVEFENGSTMRLIGPSEVLFRELSMRGSGDKVSLIEVRNGLVYFDIAQKGEDDFRVALGDHNLAVRKSAHFRADSTAPNQQIAVMKGELELLGATNPVAIKKHETLSFDSADGARYSLAKGIDSLGPDNWDRDRQQDRELYARSQEYKNSLSYAGSPYSYGMWDMASYGSWFAGPGGPCWRPMGFDMSWDPFSYGAWTYYPSNGWVFVSGYPWGWTPYRYGAWNWYGNTGWCWNPGGYYNGWNMMPVYYMVPTAYQAPTPPSKPGGPPVFIGGRKVLPGDGQDPGAYRRPARGFGHEGPMVPGKGTTATTNQQRNAGMPTAKPLTPVPSGRPWGMGAGTRNQGGMPNSRQSGPGNMPRNDSPRQNMPRSEPMPRMEPTPRMAPPPMPAPAPAPAPRMPSAPHHN
jgi:hypothetical protein